MTEEKISELKDWSIKTPHSEQNTKNIKGTKPQYQKVNIYVFEIPEKEEKVICTGKLFEETMIYNFPNIMRYKYIDPRSSMKHRQINKIKQHLGT